MGLSDLPAYGPLPGKLSLNQNLAPVVPPGSPRPFAPGESLRNPDGSWSSEISVGVQNPDLNGGRSTTIPSLWLVDGKPVRVDDDTAAKYALQSGLAWQSYDTPAAGEAADVAREARWQNLTTKQASGVPALYSQAGPNFSNVNGQQQRVNLPPEFVRMGQAADKKGYQHGTR